MSLTHEKLQQAVLALNEEQAELLLQLVAAISGQSTVKPAYDPSHDPLLQAGGLFGDEGEPTDYASNLKEYIYGQVIMPEKPGQG